jgi:predicted enzyme related to lactoylglutathione lyase
MSIHNKERKMNLKLGIVILHVNDLARARTFYTETVGLPILDVFLDGQFVTLQAGSDSQIGLSAAPAITPQAGTTEIGFEVDDVDRVYANWQTQGVTLLTQPQDFPFGRAFDAQDPDGHRLNVYKLRSMN